VWKILVVSVIFANGAHHTDYVTLQAREGGEVTFQSEAQCLDQVDRVAFRARTPEWLPGHKTKALPVGALCMPGTLADFVRTSAKPRVTADKLRDFTLPAGVFSDYQPPAAPAQPTPGQPAPPAATTPAPATPRTR
jgi:hypothetical protein